MLKLNQLNNFPKDKKEVYNIEQVLNKNYDAFKKNKEKNKQNIASVNFMNLSIDALTRKKYQQNLKTQIKNIKNERQNAIESYEFAIKHLKQIVNSLIQKNQFLNRDRHIILKQNYQLKSQLQSLRQQLTNTKQRQTIRLKNQVYNMNGLLQSGNIFEEFVCDQQTQDPMRCSVSNQTGSSKTQKEDSYQYSSDNNKNNSDKNFQSIKHSRNPSNVQRFIREGSHEILMHAGEELLDNINLEEEPQTPNYNVSHQIQPLGSNINSPKLGQQHYLEMNQDLISYKGKSSSRNISQKQVQISLNNNEIFKNSLQLNLKQKESDPSSNSKYIEQFKNHLHTPALAETSSYTTIKCSANCYEGIFRAFYISILQSDKLLAKFKKILEVLIKDDQFIIYQSYPTNSLWVNILLDFIHIIQQGQYQNSMEILYYINSHKLLDTLLIQCLKSRVQFLFGDVGLIDQQPSKNQQDENEDQQAVQKKESSKKSQNSEKFNSRVVNQSKVTNHKSNRSQITPLEVMSALSNEFDLRLQINELQYCFFQKLDKQYDQYLLSDRQSLQISLNNKQECRYYTTDEQPMFRIVMYEGMFYFNLNIKTREISEYYFNSNKNQKEKLQQNLQNSLKGYSNSNGDLSSEYKTQRQKYIESEQISVKKSPKFNQILLKQQYNMNQNNQMRQFNSFQQEEQQEDAQNIFYGLKQKKIDFNSTYQYGPIREESLQKITSSYNTSKNVSRNVSSIFKVKKQVKKIRDQIKQHQVFEDDFFLKKVKSSDSNQFFNENSQDIQSSSKKIRHKRN